MKQKKGGAGLSIDRFANAKKSTYDVRQIREKQRFAASKTIKKYKKLKQRLHPEDKPAALQVQEQEDDQPTSSQGPDNSDDDYQEQEDLKHRGHQTRKHLPSLERLAAKVHATKAAEQEEKEALLRQRREHQQKVGANIKRRKQENKIFRKQTRKGQPVMKYRIDKLLDKLQQS